MPWSSHVWRVALRAILLQWFTVHKTDMYGDALAGANALVRLLVCERDPGMAAIVDIDNALKNSGWLGAATLLVLGDAHDSEEEVRRWRGCVCHACVSHILPHGATPCLCALCSAPTYLSRPIACA